MQSKRYLITGGCGFIGSNFIKSIYDDACLITNIDKMGIGSDLENIPEYIRRTPADKYELIESNIGNRGKVKNILKLHDPRIIVHFAAESHVDRSIDSPETFMQNNIIDTFQFLETIRTTYNSHDLSTLRIINIGTDEVYGSVKYGKSQEKDTIFPSSPYSASKAAAEAIMFSYYKTYGLPIMCVRCSNNYGPRQHREKLIPLAIKRILDGEKVPIYGDGLQERDWLYVDDNCEAIRNVIEKGTPGWTYNIGVGTPTPNLHVIKIIANKLGYELNDVVEFVEDRLGHDRRYSLNNTKIRIWTGWKPKTTFEEGIEKTIKWYKEKINETN